jgi:hypothetical protein
MGDVGRARRLPYTGRRKRNKDGLAKWVNYSIKLIRKGSRFEGKM